MPRQWSNCAHALRICVPCAKERQRVANRKSYLKHQGKRRAALLANRARRKAEDPDGLRAMESGASRKWREANGTTVKASVLRYHGKPENKLRALKTVARNRGLDCTLTPAEYESVVSSRRCTYCTGPLPLYGSGLDRLDNGRGYEAGNVVACCSDCNDVRSVRFTHREMLVIGQAIAAVKAARTQAVSA